MVGPADGDDKIDEENEDQNPGKLASAVFQNQEEMPDDDELDGAHIKFLQLKDLQDM